MKARSEKNMNNPLKARGLKRQSWLLAALVVCLAPLGSHALPCGDGDTLATLSGTYGFDGRGIDHGGLLGTTRQIVVSGNITFDGSGGATDPSTLDINQNIAGTDTDLTYTGGTYSQNSDCSYTVTFSNPSNRTLNVKAFSINSSSVATVLTIQDNTSTNTNDISIDAIRDNRGATGCVQANLGGELDGNSKGFENGQNVQLTVELTVNSTTGAFTGDATGGSRTYSGALTLSSDCSIEGTLRIGTGSSMQVRGVLAQWNVKGSLIDFGGFIAGADVYTFSRQTQ